MDLGKAHLCLWNANLLVRILRQHTELLNHNSDGN